MALPKDDWVGQRWTYHRHPGLPMDIRTYIAMDAASEFIRYEYVDGYAYAMAGGTADHGRISANSYMELIQVLPRNGKCRPNIDVRLRVNPSRYFYPDAFVTCVEDDHGKEVEFEEASLIVEVRSPSTSTETFDTNEKRKFYQSLPMLHTYIQVSTECWQLEVFQRLEGTNKWILETYEAGDKALIKAWNLTIEVDHFYYNTSVPAKCP